MPVALVSLCAYLQARKGRCSRISFIDSTSLRVCHKRRIRSREELYFPRTSAVRAPPIQKEVVNGFGPQSPSNTTFAEVLTFSFNRNIVAALFAR